MMSLQMITLPFLLSILLSEAWKERPFAGTSPVSSRILALRGGASHSINKDTQDTTHSQSMYGRQGNNQFLLTPEQIEAFHRDGCVTIPDVLTSEEVDELDIICEKLLSGEIPIPGRDYCDMSQGYNTPRDQWRLINAMLPTKYFPPLLNNIFEQLTASMARQLYPHSHMTKDYDQLLNKLPGKEGAVFSWHADMAYWPGSNILGVNLTDTCTFSLALDDSDPENGCLRYVAGSGQSRTLRPHRPLLTDRDEGHALTVDVDEATEDVRYAPVRRGSLTIHNEWVVHGSGGNQCRDRQRRTYVLAYRAKEIVEAERRLGFTHSHNDNVNWDTFQDGESHRVKSQADSPNHKN